MLDGKNKENVNSSEIIYQEGPEKRLVEETIQKLVQEEIRRANALERKKRRKIGKRDEVRLAKIQKLPILDFFETNPYKPP